MLYRAWMILGFLGLAALAEGCERSSYSLTPVEGTITQGGKPLAGVRVTFYADPEAGTQGPQSSGVTDAFGHYQLRTHQGATGAVAGHHRVCISDPNFSYKKDYESIKNRLGSEEKALAYLRNDLKMSPEMIDGTLKKLDLPIKYAIVKETPLRAEVRSGGLQTFDFSVPQSIFHDR